MAETTLQFMFFATEVISAFLHKQDKPVMEIELLRLFNQERFLSSDNKKLYSLHFSLYHALYRLKQEAGVRGYYLHLDPMRIRLVRVPRQHCLHYTPQTGLYCENTRQQGNYCSLHHGEHSLITKQICYDPLRDFYLNADNISFGESDLLKKLMGGVIVYSFKKDEIQNALKFFNIKDPSKKNIQKKYYELAKKYHPDKNYGNDNNMRILNKSYQVLREVFIL